MTIDTSREAVERLLDGVTPGPWAHTMGGIHSQARRHNHWVAQFPNEGAPIATSPAETQENFAFIAASRNLVPALLAERDAALAEVARLSHAHAAERKLADDAVASLKEVSARCGPLSIVGMRAKAIIARHAARRKE